MYQSLNYLHTLHLDVMLTRGESATEATYYHQVKSTITVAQLYAARGAFSRLNGLHRRARARNESSQLPAVN